MFIILEDGERDTRLSFCCHQMKLPEVKGHRSVTAAGGGQNFLLESTLLLAVLTHVKGEIEGSYENTPECIYG